MKNHLLSLCTALLLAVCLSQPITAQAAPTEIEMVSIPAGSFEMGCQENDDNCRKNETPRHTVRIRAFEMGKYEVTQAQWQAVMGASPSNFSNCGNCPVEDVSWEDATAFAEELSALTGKRYRLPTEAEWEYACRAGGTGLYCGTGVAGSAWYKANSGRPQVVGTKRPNAWGFVRYERQCIGVGGGSLLGL